MYLNANVTTTLRLPVQELGAACWCQFRHATARCPLEALHIYWCSNVFPGPAQDCSAGFVCFYLACRCGLGRCLQSRVIKVWNDFDSYALGLSPVGTHTRIVALTSLLMRGRLAVSQCCSFESRVCNPSFILSVHKGWSNVSRNSIYICMSCNTDVEYCTPSCAASVAHYQLELLG